MPVVVSDTSCMIDLRKVGLLEALLQLPYTFVMPDILFTDEWLCLTGEEKEALCEQGLEIKELSAESVEKASHYFNRYAPLALNDCFALTLAEETQDCIFLSGDGSLRQTAERHGIQVSGVLWVTDELEAHAVVENAVLYDALKVFQRDGTIFLPENEVSRRLRRLGRTLPRA
ncbi:MAG: PIN domain-containing protein [Gammaproteobacteria bacterium]|nr:PIN domain-containing protein [Gammaproteobacteria bacterium]